MHVQCMRLICRRRASRGGIARQRENVDSPPVGYENGDSRNTKYWNVTAVRLFFPPRAPPSTRRGVCIALPVAAKNGETRHGQNEQTGS